MKINHNKYFIIGSEIDQRDAMMVQGILSKQTLPFGGPLNIWLLC